MSEDEESNKAIIVDGIKKGLTKMVIMVSLIRNDPSLDLTTANSLYKTVGTENNLLLDKDTKDKLVEEIGAKFTVEGKFDREKAVAELTERGGITKNSAVNRLKGYCASNEIEFPVASRSLRDMEAVHNAYKTWFEQKTSREAIQAGLVEHFKYPEKSVSQAYLKIGKELGLIAEEVSHGRADLAKWFATAENVKGEKKDIIARLRKDTQIAEATAKSRYTMYLFALDFYNIVTAPAVEEDISEVA